VDEAPRFTVEPVTLLALFQLGSRFLVLGAHRERWGFHRSLGEARLAAGRLNNPPAWSR
jgi:hypothetical protein